MEKIISSYQKLDAFVRLENYMGYDPYDTLNSSIPFRKMGKWGPVLAIQFQKRNPFNFRGVLGIKKDTNPKAIGLFLHSYSLRCQAGERGLEPTMDELFQRLLELRTEGYKEYCWGYNFDWASPVKFLPKWSPTIVVTGFIAKGVFEYYQATKNQQALTVLRSISDFILNHLPLSEDETGICFSYSTQVKDCCYNASMLGCEHFSRMYHLTGEERFKDLATRSANFTLSRQKQDGSWKYSINLESGEERSQIDFHQGYVLDSLHYYIEFCKPEDERYKKALADGAKFYFEQQFESTGQSFWRLPKKWPVEIHNQSQGIITFIRLKYLDERYAKFSRRIAEWTLENMFNHKKGYFYYKKYPTHTMKTPMMRWSQAWMHLALNELILAGE